MESARAAARNLSAQARAEIQREKEAALAQMREEIASLAIQAAGKILDETLDAERHRKIVAAFIDTLPKN